MQPNLPLDLLIGALRTNANLPADLAEATPPQAYTSQPFLDKELDEIFNHEWICVGREDEFGDAGSYRVVTIGRDPVIILRGRDGTLRALSNICRHRMASLLEGEGRLKGRIKCPYHAWTYDLDGALVGATHMRNNFDKSAVCLPRFRTELWNGWVYVSLDENAEPLAPRLEKLDRRLRNFRMDEFRSLFRVDEVWATNWKILVQNFIDGYHLFSVHEKTVEPVLPTRLAEVEAGGPGYCLFKQGRVPGVAYEYGSAMAGVNPQLSPEEENSVPIFCVYPSHVVSISPERMFWMSLQPLAVDKVRVLWGVDIFPGTMPEGPGAQARIAELKQSFTAINGEDKTIVEAIARNASALAADPGRLSPKENTIWEFQRYLARRLCGAGAVRDQEDRS